MARKSVREELEALRRKAHNLKPSDIERLARRAGWVYDRTKGSHATYIKEGFPRILTIKLDDLGGKLALRLLSIIESSLYEEEE
jgi:predicted RNA binding protein YcfA (HicA-like mRNA interferase family)